MIVVEVATTKVENGRAYVNVERVEVEGIMGLEALEAGLEAHEWILDTYAL